MSIYVSNCIQKENGRVRNYYNFSICPKKTKRVSNHTSFLSNHGFGVLGRIIRQYTWMMDELEVTVDLIKINPCFA